MKRKDALWVMQMCRDRDARSEAEKEAFDTAIEALKSESIFTADRPRPIEPTVEVDLESGVVPISACEPKGPKTIIYADRPKGKWVAEEEYGDLWVCDQCGFASEYKDNFCPNCGADMRGGDK